MIRGILNQTKLMGGMYLMKRKFVISMLTALIVCISSVTFAAANPFSDIPSNHWAYDDVTELAAEGIVEGYGDGTFLGNRNATRYDVAIMVAKLYSKKTHEPIAMSFNPFSDLPSNHRAAEAVVTLARAGIEEGYGDGTFLGNRNITKGELRTMLNKLFRATGVKAVQLNQTKRKVIFVWQILIILQIILLLQATVLIIIIIFIILVTM